VTRLLAKAGIADALAEARRLQWVAKQMEVDEAKARISNDPPV